jgi:glycosyltransferase involved in cell wall biosynthesis
MPQLLVVEDRIPWFGRYNGYEQLSRYLSAQRLHEVLRPEGGWWPRLRGKLFSVRHGIGPAPHGAVDVIRRYGKRLTADPGSIGHVLYGEHFLDYLVHLPSGQLRQTVATLHQPFALWSAQALRRLAELPHRIHLSTPPLGTFEPHRSGSTTVILHGVDVDFYTPGAAPPQRRVLYSGIHLRNLLMLERVVERLLACDRGVVVDMLVPLAHRRRDVFDRLAQRERVVWHAGLDEHRLRELYRRSSALLLPLDDSCANTAVVEALAVGLPLVTTDVGGIRDYGGGSAYPIVANDDVDAATELLRRLLDDPSERARQAAAQRQFAVERLDWSRIVAEHLVVYQRVAADPPSSASIGP